MYDRTRCTYNVHPGSLQETLSNLRNFLAETYSFPQSFFGFTESSFSQRKLLSVWGEEKNNIKKSYLGLLLSLGPDSLFEVAKNDLKPIFHVLKFTACQTASCQ